MACYKPLNAYQDLSTGEIVFQKTSSHYLKPTPLACGQCIGCRIQKNTDWAIRCVHESHCHNQNCFITLTYEDEQLPENGTLVKRDYQLFFKRLRKQLDKQNIKISYFLSGEYGDRTDRAHYHACIFGFFPKDAQKWSENKGNTLYTSELFNKTWKKGHVVIGYLTQQSAAYTASYVFKKITGDKAKDHYERINHDTGEVYQLLPEFASMSRSKGIGYGFYQKYKSNIFPSDHVIDSNYQTKSVPKYYDRKYKESDPERFEQIQEKRKIRGQKYKSENTPERLAVREQVILARINLHSNNQGL